MSDDQREHRPSLQTTREKVEAATEANHLPEIPGLLDRLAQREQAREKANNPRWSKDERDRLLAEIEDALHPDVEVLRERAKRQVTLGLNQEEGVLRADSGFNAEIEAVAARASLMAVQASSADASAAIAVFEDAAFTDNADLIRAVGGAVLTRLKELAAKDSGLPQSPARNSLLGFEGRWQAWLRANPSPRERLAMIERERFNRHMQIDEAVTFILRLHGIGRPATPPVLRSMPEVFEQTSRLREGPAFDLFNRRPGNVRR